MKNTFKKITVICLIFLILSLYGTNICFADSNEATEPTEAKTYCKATLDDDFADNRVLIVLNNKVSLEFKTYTLGDFAEIECASIKELTIGTSAMVKNKLLNGGKSDTAFEVDVDQFRRIFCIELKTHSKENVLEVIKKLEMRDDILYAGPDYIISICETTPNKIIVLNTVLPHKDNCTYTIFNHTKYCNFCRFSIIEKHNWTEFSSYYKYSNCEYITSIIPVE